MAKLKDKSEPVEKVITSKGESWISQLEAKNTATVNAEIQTEKVEQKVSPISITKTKKIAKNRPSHHRGQGKISNTLCIMLNSGTAIKMFRKQADQLVQDGSAKYVSKSAWRALNGSSDISVPTVSITHPTGKQKKKLKTK